MESSSKEAAEDLCQPSNKLASTPLFFGSAALRQPEIHNRLNLQGNSSQFLTATFRNGSFS